MKDKYSDLPEDYKDYFKFIDSFHITNRDEMHKALKERYDYLSIVETYEIIVEYLIFKSRNK